MTTMVTEVYDALLSAGAPEDKARAAAEVLSNYDERFNHLERRIDGVESNLSRRIDGVEGRVNLLAGMVGTNITLTLLVLGKLFLLPGAVAH